ncbi:hypothetical protein AN958_10035 [Leucoagaricus sp. SymC.cos]|nr:hypothetical protein AN958_10035 [Leucoagaricus sp. SymC.cos]
MADQPDRSPNQPAELDIDQLEPGTLYAVLTYRGDFASWNWSFFVPDPAASPVGSSGTIFHVVNDPATDEWKLEDKTRDVLSWPLVVTIVALADVTFLSSSYEELVGKDSLLPIFKTVVIPGKTSTQQLAEFSSRTWFLDAIFSLHDCGVLQCDDVWLLERELRRCAFKAMEKYSDNRGWTAYKAERCS